MTRLIDADDIVLDYSGLAYIPPLDFRGTAKYFAKQIDAMPTIDAIPIEWIEKYYANHPFNFVSGMLYDWAIEQMERKEE